MKKLKSVILLSITTLAALVFIVSSCCIDSDTPIFYIMATVSVTWLFLFAKANEDRFTD